MGDAPPRHADRPPSSSAVETVHRVCLEQSKYWRCMAPLAFNNKPLYKKAVRLHDVVRSYQAQVLQKQFNMVPLPLLQDRVSASFENQAFSTVNIHSVKTLLVYIHDAPEVWSNPAANQHRLKLHNTFLVSHNLAAEQRTDKLSQIQQIYSPNGQ